MSGRRLPPLNSLRAFEAAARHQSLSRAAQELSVTHGAVSRQVAKLEEFLNAQLFERKHQQVLLTKKGAEYAARLQVLFDQIHEATVTSFDIEPQRGTLRIGVPPTFAMRLLVPRLARFKQAFPELKLQVDTYRSPQANYPQVEVDVAVLLGKGDWPQMVSKKLFDEELMPVGSPALLDGHRIRCADDLAPFLLLHAQRRPNDWKLWLDAMGGTKIDPHSGLRLEYSSLVYQGAIDGLGLAMAQTMFVQDYLAEGKLAPVFGAPLQTGKSYYVVCAEANAAQTKINNFIRWLIAELSDLTRYSAVPQRRLGAA